MTAEGAKGNFDLNRKLTFATDNFRDQIHDHLGTQMMQGNFKMTESLINELEKQQDM